MLSLNESRADQHKDASKEEPPQKCADIISCANAIGTMLGQKYLMDSEVKGTFIATSNLQVTRENAELIFTAILNLNQYSRVPLDDHGTFQIMRQRDARDSAIPMVSADKLTEPKLPHNWDYYTLRYKASHPEVAEHIARSVRGFMPANARIIPDELSGTVTVTDSALNLAKIYQIIAASDAKPTPALLKRWDEEQKISQAEARARAHQWEQENGPNGPKHAPPPVTAPAPAQPAASAH